MKSAKLIPSVSVADHPDFATVTNSPEWGYGVWSWHLTQADAEHNARITGGRAVPVDYVDGEMIIPSLAIETINRSLGTENWRRPVDSHKTRPMLKIWGRSRLGRLVLSPIFF